MHELALATSIVRLATARAGTRRVTKVNVQVGRLRQVVPSSLQLAFDVAARGTNAEGAELEIEDTGLTIRCAECDAESRGGAFPLRCPFCESLAVEIVAGDELLVESIEIEEDECIART
jgi:hydrogenase nickel incorporation protein HypA/HybF